MSMIGFCNAPEDVQWLKDTHLKGVPLPSPYSDFKSFVLQGNEDAPHAVNLYNLPIPYMTTDYYRVRFVNDSGAYAECAEYNGHTDKPYGGLAELE